MQKAMLLLVLTAAAPPVVVEPRAFAGRAPRSDSAMRSAMIAGHDDARDAVLVPRLAWDRKLAEAARDYARVLAKSGRFEHSGVPGENLWTGTRGAYRYDEMVAHWAAERRYLKPGRVPDLSTTGRFGDVGHYTQMVWPATTRFGCGFAGNGRAEYLVCRYAPAGNVFGQPLTR